MLADLRPPLPSPFFGALRRKPLKKGEGRKEGYLFPLFLGSKETSFLCPSEGSRGGYLLNKR